MQSQRGSNAGEILCEQLQILTLYELFTSLTESILKHSFLNLIFEPVFMFMKYLI
jgi:hypothetical protein